MAVFPLQRQAGERGPRTAPRASPKHTKQEETEKEKKVGLCLHCAISNDDDFDVGLHGGETFKTHTPVWGKDPR